LVRQRASACLLYARMLAVATLTTACSDSTAPTVEGAFGLTALNAQPLPYDDSLGCCVYLAGRMSFARDRFEIVITSRTKFNQQIADATGAGIFNQHGSALTFQQDAGDVPFLLADGQISADTIRVALGGEGPGAPDQFHAIFVRVP
jgi:hypothetical protein